MRVLLVTHRFPPEGRAGVERNTEATAAELRRVGADVAVFTGSPSTPRDSAIVRDETTPDGTVVRRIANRDVQPDSFLLRHAEHLAFFDDLLARFVPDVVHVNHLLGLPPGLVRSARRSGAALVLRVPDFYVICARHLLLTPSWMPCGGPEGGRRCASVCFAHEGATAEIRWTLRNRYFGHVPACAGRVLAASRFAAETFAPLLGEPTRLRVVPLGLPRPIARARPREPDAGGPLRIVYFGTVGPHKGVDLAVRALAGARLGVVRFDVAGEFQPGYGVELIELARRVAGLDLRLTGPYDLGDLPGLVARAHFAVVPSRAVETYCFAAREALALGLPVVAARAGALPEIVVNGLNGLTFEPGDVDDLSRAIVTLAEDQVLRRRLREGARRTRLVSVDDYVADLVQIYEEAVAEGPVGGTCDPTTLLADMEDELLAAGFGDARLPTDAPT